MESRNHSKNGANPKSQTSRKTKTIKMKIKQATQMAIIGVIIQLIPATIWSLSNIGILKFINQDTNEQYWYFKWLGILGIIGTALLLPFFITLFKNQK